MPNICDLHKETIGKYLREKHGDIVGRLDEFKKLENYESNDPLAHLRTFREEVKRAAKDGKDTLLVPSGETAMKIEGLGSGSGRFRIIGRNGEAGELITSDTLKVGQEINQGGVSDNWIITDILGDGKFKAVPKHMTSTRDNGYTKINDDLWADTRSQETFDISGKVDTQHFVYKLNEEAIPKEARKQGLIVEGKMRQDNGEWWKIKIPRERAGMPVEAFGALAIPLLNKKEEEKPLFIKQ